ncbi:hypothetical protein K1T71_012502 [Dendrolimus kikuchii]|uniref:Uncharacterized protein n=1 Tax=Dendrolimus kikuchii TaxID=765133 RepID=A0ACC1CJI6_9NEOP|nr:hypothetical protein K1T71_012502 [Dendrolimus kikuchii]
MWKLLLLCGMISAAPHENINYKSLNEFSLRLLDNTYAFNENFGKSNFAISPLSLWSIFALLAEGSSGQTCLELIKELQLPTELRATQALHLAAKKILKTQYNDIILKGQSAMFADCTLDIHAEFCSAALAYDTGIYSVDASNTTLLANDINYYICVATEGQILNAVREENLNNLRMVLIDALYFKANWTHPFDPTHTREEAFYNYQGKPIGTVNMMHHKAPHNLRDALHIDAQILELNYGTSEEFSMLVLLPIEGVPIKQLLNSLAYCPLDWLTNFRDEDNNVRIDVYLPRIKLSSQTDLITPLQYTGIQTIFDSKRAELPGVSDSPLYVSSTVQSISLEVTEEGTVATAATVVGLEDRVLGQRFEANKEFVFLITERRTNLILFAGVYQDPFAV